MNETTALSNIGELSKPATVLIEKVSDAIGGIFRPWQIRRVALANQRQNKSEQEPKEKLLHWNIVPCKGLLLRNLKNKIILKK